MNRQPSDILLQFWGYDAFRPLQSDIITSILSGRDTLALLPTGGGKSICFQVPALCMEGLCLVISPLIALMKDQVDNLTSRDIPALIMHTGMNYKEIESILRKACTGQYRFLYCSPERLQSRLFKEYLPALPLSFVAVDEAHCISQWGYDFRPSYMQIVNIREQKPGIPFLALTASATPDVRQDIMSRLKFKEGAMFAGSFARPNLAYHVVPDASRIHRCVDIVKRMKGSGLVYCKSRKRTMEMADLLKQESIEADFYHAGLPQDLRNQRQQSWLQGDTRVMVCTNAFGMGIDKPNVRFVVHLDCPDSMEHYYQEAGRAGRDGENSHAVLLTSPSTATELEKLPDIRYPSIQTIRKVYQALCDHIQVAAGTGEEHLFAFDLNEFVRLFRMNVFEVIYSIEAMDQEGILERSEQVFQPSKVWFTINREGLEYAEAQHPDLEPLTKALLRTYGGIWDQPTSISEYQLARILRASVAEIQKALTTLTAMGTIKYEPRKETPQIRLLQNRVKAEDLYINPERYLERKQAFVKRIQAMVRFISSKEQCRTQLLCDYFGDKVEVCGICDVCRQQKKSADKQLAATVEERIKKLLQKTARPATELRGAFAEEEHPHFLQVLSAMEAEGLVYIDAEGRIALK